MSFLFPEGSEQKDKQPSKPFDYSVLQGTPTGYVPLPTNVVGEAEGSLFAANFRNNTSIGAFMNSLSSEAINQDASKSITAQEMINLIPRDLVLDYADRYIGKDPAHFDEVTAQIRSELADKQLIANHPWKSFAVNLIEQPLDPVNWLPLGAFAKNLKRGSSVVRSIVGSGATVAAGTAVQEAILQRNELTREAQESVFNVAVSGVIGAALGGIGVGITVQNRASRLAQIKARRNASKEVMDVFTEKDKQLDANGLLKSEDLVMIPEPVRKLMNITPMNRLLNSPFGTAKFFSNAMYEHNYTLMKHLDERTDGASVETLTRLDIGKTKSMMIDYQNIYFDMVGINKGPFKGTRAKLADVNMTMDQFNEAAWRRISTQTESPNEHVNRAARLLEDELFNKTRDRAVELGLLDEKQVPRNAPGYIMSVYNKNKIIEQGGKSARGAGSFPQFLHEKFTEIQEQVKKFKKSPEYLETRKKIRDNRLLLKQNIEQLESEKKKPEQEFRRVSADEDLTTKEFYHGSGELSDLNDFDITRSGIRSLYGEGLYITDDPAIAKTYAQTRGTQARKQDQAKIISMKFKKQPNLIDINKPPKDDVFKIVKEAAEGSDVEISDRFKSKSLDEIFSFVKTEIEDNNDYDYQSTVEQIYEMLSEVNNELHDSGYDGYLHTGGKVTKGKPHNVVVMFGQDFVQDGVRVAKSPAELLEQKSISHIAEQKDTKAEIKRIEEELNKLEKNRLNGAPPKGLNSDGELFDVVDSETLWSHVEQTIDNILGDSEGQMLNPILDKLKGGTKPLKSRKMTVTQDDMLEWHVTDIPKLVDMYSRAMHPTIRLTEFAQKMGAKDISEMREKFSEMIMNEFDEQVKGKTGKDATALRKKRDAAISDMKDTISLLQGVYGDGPNVLNDSARNFYQNFLKWNYIRLLGYMTISSIADAGMQVFVHGPYRFIHEGLVQSFSGVRKIAKQDLRAIGYAIETELGTRIKSYAEHQGLSTNPGPFTKGLDALTQGFGNLSLMNQWNSLQQSIAGHIGINRTLQTVHKFMRGEKVSKIEMERVLKNGLDKEHWKTIYEFTKDNDSDGTLFADWTNWDITTKEQREALTQFQASVAKEIDNIVIVPGLGDKPLFAQKPLGKLLFQFKTFLMAATNRVTVSGIQRRNDVNTYLGVLSMLGMGALSYVVASLVRGNEPDMSFENLSREAVDKSGVLGIWGEFGNIAAKPLGFSSTSRYASRDTVGALIGPSAGAISEVLSVLRSTADSVRGESDMTTKDAQKLLRLAPMQNLFYIHQLNRKAARGLALELGATDNE